ncbi:MAG TPA: cell division protein FtsA [Candidatus Saccharimonadales bacterium]|nr:cell division protein FtsA [Candidatus Saccharimonadales bacterium]
MHDQSLPHYVGLDVGTSTVRCIVGVGDVEDPSKASIVGFGKAPNNGMRKGSVIYVDDVAEAIAQAVTEAERLSGMQIHQATVNINGSHVSGINSKGVIAISAANREINDNDRLRVEEAATIVQLPPNREIVQVFAKNYRLDGQDNIKDPVGMQGVRLEVDTHIVTASLPSLRNLDMALERVQITPNRHTFSSLAAAEAVLSRQQKEAGTLLLDIGAGTTNLLVIEDGEIQHVAVLPIGGQNITNDLAIGLKTDLDIAEKVKINYATLEDKSKKEAISLEANKKTQTFKVSEIVMITEARVDEILDYIEKELRLIQRSRKLPGGVVLVGGTAKLPGIAEFTREKLQLAVRVGKLHNISGLVESVNDPSNSTAVGLMLLDMLLAPVGHDGQSGAFKQNTKFLGSFNRLLKSIRR